MRSLPTFNGFVGQRHIVDSLRQHCAGALAKHATVPHIRFDGSSGMGKTELASALAKELGTTLHSVYCSFSTKPWELATHLSGLRQGDVIFLDECHALSDSAQEILYPAIDRNQAPQVDRERHRILDNEWVDIPKFTLVVATDQPGALKNALRQRLPLHYTLVPYELSEIREIVRNRAAQIGILLSDQAVTRIAQASRGLPREVRHRLASLSICMPDTTQPVSRTMVNDHLATVGIDDDDLNTTDRRYLGVLADSGESMSLETLVIRLGSDAITLRREVENYLTEKGLIAFGSRGRFLTEKGKRYVAEHKVAGNTEAS